MEFLQPTWGIASLILAGTGVLWLLWSGARRRRFLAQWFTDGKVATDVSPGKRIGRGALLVVSLVLICLALARPQRLEQPVAESVAGDVILLVDCSSSMLAADVAPNRFALAVGIARELVLRAPAGRIGLVAFAGEAFAECPPTHDRDTVRRYLDRLNCESIPLPGSYFPQPVAEALRLLDPRRRAVLVLLSDGEETVQARAIPALPAGTALFAVGVGNPEMASPIPTPQGPLRDPRSGQPVATRPDFAALERLADRFLAADAAAPERVGEWLREHFTPESADSIPVDRALELYPWLALAALLCLLARWLLDERRKLAVLALLVLAATVQADPGETYAQGLTLLREQSFAEAVVLWSQLARQAGPDVGFQAAVRLNLGVAHHQLGRQLVLEPNSRARARSAFAEAETCYRACLWDDGQSARAARNLARLEQDRLALDPPPREPAPPPSASQTREPPAETPPPQPGTGEAGQTGEGEGEATARSVSERELTPAETAAALAAMRENEGDFNEALRRKAARTWRTAPPERPW